MRGMIHGTMHLCIGQEASAVATCMELSDADKITSTHRGHGHCIAKGAEVRRMFAEFFGREDGYCHGRGGSMHIADVTKGNLGANGIVGGGLPIAVGAALAAKRARPRRRHRLLLRRRRQQRGRLPRVAEHGGDLEAAGDLRLREQPVRHVDLDRALDRGEADQRARRQLRDARRHRRRQRLLRRRRGDERGDRPRPRRRGPEPGREPDLPLARPLQVRPQPLPHQGRDRELDRPRPDRALPHRADRPRHRHRGRRRRRCCRRPRPRSPPASSSPRRARRPRPPRSPATSTPGAER